MAKQDPAKKGWKKAVEAFIQEVMLAHKGENGTASLKLDGLMLLIRAARNRKRDMNRAKTWYESIRDIVVAQMLKRGLNELYVNSRTFTQLVPDLKMGKGDAGEKRFTALVKKYGHEWVVQHVMVVRSMVPAMRVETITNDPRVKKGEPQPGHLQAKAFIETEYTFVGEGTTEEKLEWTVAMGNKPTFEVGPVPDRFKQGKERNAKRGKRK